MSAPSTSQPASAAPRPRAREPEVAGAPEARWAIGLALAGLVLRLGWTLEASRLPFFWLPATDDFVYLAGARRIASGDLFLDGEHLHFGPPYFYALALVLGSGGDEHFAPRIVQAIVSAASILLVFDAARSVVGPRWALFPAAALAVYGPAIFFVGLVLPETLSLFFHALFAAAALRAIRSGDPRVWAVAGAAIGASIALRPTAALPFLVALGFAARPGSDRRERTRRALSLGLAAALAIAPVLVRSAVATGSPLLAGTAGMNLFIGNGPGANGLLRVPPETPLAGSPGAQFVAFREVAEEAEGRSLDVSEVDRYWTLRTLAHVAAHPLEAGALFARKLRLVWNARELSTVVSYDFTSELSGVLRPLPGFAWIGPLALAGLASALRRREARTGFVVGCTLAGTLGIAAFFVQDRYRLPLMPFVLVLGAVGLEDVSAIVRARDRGAGAVWVAGAALGLALALPPVAIREHRERDFTELGRGYLELGWSDEAEASFERALALAPRHLPALEGMARSREARGDLGAAVGDWTAVRDAAREGGDPAAEARAERRLTELRGPGP